MQNPEENQCLRRFFLFFRPGVFSPRSLHPDRRNATGDPRGRPFHRSGRHSRSRIEFLKKIFVTGAPSRPTIRKGIFLATVHGTSPPAVVPDRTSRAFRPGEERFAVEDHLAGGVIEEGLKAAVSDVAVAGQLLVQEMAAAESATRKIKGQDPVQTGFIGARAARHRGGPRQTPFLERFDGLVRAAGQP